MFKHAIVLIVALLLAGCAVTYTPTIYPLRPGLVATLELNGPVSVTNAQPSTDSTTVYSYMGTTLSSDLHTITDSMVSQTRDELQKNGHQSGNGAPKTIALKVNYLESTYIVMYWKSEIHFDATLGNGQTIPFVVHHSSGVAVQDLDGCIAEGVMTLLNDARVKAYLAG